MKILGLSILRRNGDNDAILMTQATKLDDYNFFTRGNVREYIGFFAKTITIRTELGTRQSVENQDYYVHVYLRADGLCGCVTCDSEYPPRVAYTLISQLLEDFSTQHPPNTPKDWTKCETPESIVWPVIDQVLGMIYTSSSSFFPFWSIYLCLTAAAAAAIC